MTSESIDSRNERLLSSEISSITKGKINNDPLISVIIPVFNEENTIKNVIERIPNHQEYEIIIVDDGSTDNSIKNVQELQERKVKIVKHTKNKGYGEAVLSGFRQATGDIIVTLDSDGQHNPEEIPQLIKPIINNKADMVIGSRYLGKCHYKMPLYVKVGEFFVQLCMRLLFLQRVYDNQCGFRAFKKEMEKIFSNMRYTDMGFSTEMLFKTAFYKFKILEIPVSVNPRKYGTSYVNLIRITKSISSCIIFYILRKFKLNINRFFLKKFVDYFYRRIKYKRIFQ
ncbi:MAG: glycosyltransferase family 2 protein [Promethearchaeota archaeon]